MKYEEIRNKLIENGLKVTPQRIAVLEAIIKLNNHPTAENIIDFIRKKHPNIATATVYKVLDALTGHKLVEKVNTDNDVMRYDAVMLNHHHIYCSDSDKIEDYYDNELNRLLKTHFKQKTIPGFRIEEIRLQITGKYEKN